MTKAQFAKFLVGLGITHTEEVSSGYRAIKLHAPAGKHFDCEPGREAEAKALLLEEFEDSMSTFRYMVMEDIQHNADNEFTLVEN